MSSSSQSGPGLSESILWSLTNGGYAPSKTKYSDALEEIFLDEITQSVDILAPWLNIGKLKAVGLLKPRKQTRILAVPPTGMPRCDAEKLVQETAKRSDLEAHQLKAGADERFPHLKMIRLDRGSDGQYVILGSSNLTFRGLESNWEANVLLPVQKVRDGDSLWKLFDTLWNMSMALNPDSFGVSPQPIESPAPRDLLDFQWDCYEELRKTYETKSDDNGTILSLPTGSGKTMIATRFLLNHVLKDKDRRVLWVAPHEELLDQAYETFKDQEAFRVPQVRITPWRKSAPSSGGESHSNVEFRTLQSIHKNGPPWKDFNCLVVDEAHWGASNSCRMLPELVKKSGGAFRLGLTATPYRRCIEEIHHLMDRFGEGNLIERNSEDIEKRTDVLGRPILAKVKHKFVPTSPAFSIKLDPQDFGSLIEFEGKALKEFNDPKRNKVIADAWETENYGLTLVFAVNIDHANALAKTFKNRYPDKNVQVVHSGEVGRGLDLVVPPTKDHTFSREDRRQIRECFQNGEIDILVSVDLYIMGVDFPKVRTLFMARPTLSPVLYAQMLGRGRRGPAFGGTDTVTVVDFTDQIEAHDKLNKHIVNVLSKNIINFDREQNWESDLKKQMLIFEKRLAMRPVAELLDDEIGQAVYWVETKGGRDCIRPLERTSNLTDSLRRGLHKGQYPIRNDHQVFYIKLRDGEDLKEVYFRWKGLLAHGLAGNTALSEQL